MKYKGVLNLSYGAIQGFYWMAFGAILSFASAYLLEKSYSNSQIGLILAVSSIAAVGIQPILADIGDRSKKLTTQVLTGLVGGGMALLTFFLLFFNTKSLFLSLIYAAIVAFLTSLQPLINSLAFSFGGPNAKINFGITRSLGSVAYALLCAVLGSAIEAKGAGIIPLVAIPIFLLMVLALWTTNKINNRILRNDKFAGVGPENGRLEPEESSIGLGTFMRRNKFFVIFSIGIMFLFINNSVINNYMLQIITPLGGGSDEVGKLLSFMALLELPGLIFFSRLNVHFSCRLMLKLSSVAFIAKIFLTYIAGSVNFIYIAFLFQLISFPVFLSSAVHLVDEVMEKGEAVKGQSLVTVTMTLSSVIASLIGGLVLDYSGPSALLLLSTVFTVIGTLIIIFAVNRIPNR